MRRKTERERFEAWARRFYGPYWDGARVVGRYVCRFEETAWRAWQAAKRSAIGERAGRAKLSEAQAQDILDSIDRPEIAASRNGVSIHTVRGIRKRRIWRHLSPATARTAPAVP